MSATQDSDDLEALFDSIVSATQQDETSAEVVEADSGAEGGLTDGHVINRIGQMTRALHDSLRELGFDKNLERAAAAIPDARDRLNYVAAMTEQAAERVLNATEAAQPILNKVEDEAHRLATQWQMLFDQQLTPEQFKSLATQTHAYLIEVPKQTKAASAQLREIMMAQDFQDLTGQVIKKIMEVTQQLEQQMVSLLVDSVPAAALKADSGLLNGPVIKAEGRSDVVTSQDQVDDLLDSLGF
ncbi:protein phosphatase CheZ [Ferriphaselus sp. R-1]|uniref:protein phosphatase CheZ n=1 Tax=Ferriphaselus sp. R-1 TaxID=1485544 RepID=UPI00055014B7|nr:protein phosphatase CheZ [Ferriphaselus sp. R-1]